MVGKWQKSYLMCFVLQKNIRLNVSIDGIIDGRNRIYKKKMFVYYCTLRETLKIQGFLTSDLKFLNFWHLMCLEAQSSCF